MLIIYTIYAFKTLQVAWIELGLTGIVIILAVWRMIWVMKRASKAQFKEAMDSKANTTDVDQLHEIVKKNKALQDLENKVTSDKIKIIQNSFNKVESEIKVQLNEHQKQIIINNNNLHKEIIKIIKNKKP